MSRKIDAFTHILTEEFYDELVDRYGFQGLSGPPDFLWDIEKRKEDMDKYGVDKQVITLALPPIWRGMDPEKALRLTELANDEVKRVANENPDLFIPVGTIPFVNDGFLDEFERCVDDLDMAGVQIFSNVGGRPIDSERFIPLYKSAERKDVPLWIHPQLHEWYDWADEYMDHRLFGWPFDTTLALSRLVFSGVMERFPGLKVISHHAGGMVPFYGERIRSFYKTRLEYPENYPGKDWPDFSKPVQDYFKDFYADTAVSGSVPALECAHDFFGDGNMVYGTDYPFGPERGREYIRSNLEAVGDMKINDTTRRKILGENILSLI